MEKPLINKLFIGKVKELGKPDATDKMDRPWKTGMFKHAVSAPVYLGDTGFNGDEVADTKNHGGPEKAVFAYPAFHYSYWREELGLSKEEIGPGSMGENFSMENMDETSVCIGDTYRCGDALIQVSQPRRPCWKPARRHRVIDFALRIQNSGRTGWYYRVIQTGTVEPGTTLTLEERPYPEWTIEACNTIMYKGKRDLEQTRALADCELLAPNWKRTLSKRLKGMESSSEKRVYGPNR
ncbi:Protein YiiM [Lentibacillus sp. JNUCC-1]|nr:MOSC domain-containing protein [Lentibacillus sp. JNUCC-1]MUV38578.1 Protein YiiM [Lentibacillus sp. JNUCC-1]